MQDKYENLLNEIEEISIQSYTIAEILYGYCEYCDGEKISSSMIRDFFKEIKEKQQKIITLIDEKTTEINYEFYIKNKQVLHSK